ncbi:MAG TPA: hypothetical protein VHZ96_13600 [Frankiaceae bacterium]|nr:hypothetical protein [Frankiaceae bacterium]
MGLFAILVAVTVAVAIVVTRHHQAATEATPNLPPQAAATAAPSAAPAVGPSASPLTPSLLTTNEVNAATHGAYTQAAGVGYSINGYPSGCPGLAYIPGEQRAEATEGLLEGNLTVEEAVSSLPGSAASVVNQFRRAANTCHTAEISSTEMSVIPVVLPQMPGVDESAGVLIEGQLRGKLFAVEFGLARVGDTVVGLSVFAEGPPNLTGPSLKLLMPLAVAKARLHQ